jgi:hypothetical protein
MKHAWYFATAALRALALSTLLASCATRTFGGVSLREGNVRISADINRDMIATARQWHPCYFDCLASVTC